jgi:hypothetical protein
VFSEKVTDRNRHKRIAQTVTGKENGFLELFYRGAWQYGNIL